MAVKQEIEEHIRNGESDLAQEKLESCLAKGAGSAEDHHLLAVLLLNKRCFNQALEHLRQAMKAEVNHEQYNTLGAIYLELKDYEKALQAFLEALTLEPTHFPSKRNLLVTYQRMGRIKEALVCCDELLESKESKSAQLYFELALIYREGKKIEKALECVYESMTLNPNQANAHCLLGTLFQEMGHLKLALAPYMTAVQLAPDNKEMRTLIGALYEKLDKVAEAKKCFEKVLELDAEDVRGHYNLGVTLQTQGEFKKGFKEYEKRFQLQIYRENHAHLEHLQGSLWTDQDIRGKKLLIVHEQGFGDNILAVRFLEQVVDLGAEVMYLAPPRLQRFFSHGKKSWQLVDEASYSQLPAYDYYLPIWSLFDRLNIDPTQLSTKRAYLEADPHLARQYQEKYFSHNKQKIGFIWRSHLRGFTAEAKSISPYFLSPFFHLPNSACYALQTPLSDKDRLLFKEFPLVDLSTELQNFDNTAALMSNMDMVITIDTACAHLAGALGLKTVLLLCKPLDWRWKVGDVWYANMHTFTQTEAGCWRSPVNEAYTFINS